MRRLSLGRFVKHSARVSPQWWGWLWVWHSPWNWRHGWIIFGVARYDDELTFTLPSYERNL